jgi:hypothetical protein
VTKLQVAAYNAQRAAGLPVSTLAEAILIVDDGKVNYRHCATYIHAVQQLDWFEAAFTSHAGRITVAGGRGVSHADAVQEDAGESGSGATPT